MKIQWSAFFSVLTLATLMGCGAEQFGTTPQSSTSNPDAISSFEQNSCSSYTLVKPKVDIIYMIDNTQSYYYSSQDLKNAIAGTLNQVSSQFDYRIITTTLVNPIQDLRDTYTNYNSSTDNSVYRILTNSSTALPSSVVGNKVISVGELTSFITVLDKPHRERGLWRLKEFMKRHRDTGLLRQEAYQLIVMVSNNRDMDVENVSGNSTSINQAVFDTRLSELNQLRAQLQSKQTRLFSVTAQSACQTGWIPSTHSYVKMSQAFGVSDNYDLCSSSFASIFSEVNSSIQQVIVPHVYRYWPITFLQNGDDVGNYANLKVYKITSDGPVLIPSSSYTYKDNSINGAYANPPALNILTTSNPSEVVTGRRHYVQFNSGAEVTYPDCVQIRTTTKTEYFGYVVLQREPKPETIYVTINGNAIPQSATDGWTYRGNISVPNIKVTHPNSNGSELPALPRSGFMIQLNGVDNYYKSGDNVQVNFIPAAI